MEEVKTSRRFVKWVLVILSSTPLMFPQSQQGAQQQLTFKNWPKDSTLTCSSVQLVRGHEPLKLRKVLVQRLHMSFTRPHVTIVKVRFQKVKTLQTDNKGIFRFPRLKEGTYELQIGEFDEHLFAQVVVAPKSRPSPCTQALEVE